MIVFDREGYSPAFFKEMWTKHRIACITYYKHPKKAWPEECFVETQFTLPNGEQALRKLAENGLISLGGRIFQPGLLDGGESSTDQVATLTQFIEIKESGINKVDCAIAEFLASVPVNPRHMPSVGKLSSTTPVAAAEDMLAIRRAVPPDTLEGESLTSSQTRMCLTRTRTATSSSPRSATRC